MSTVILDTITGKSTSTTITIGSTPVVSASANSMTIRGEGSAQTSIQQGLCKAWCSYDGSGTVAIDDSFNMSGITDTTTGSYTLTINSDMSNTTYSSQSCGDQTGGATSTCITNVNSSATALFICVRQNGTTIDNDDMYLTVHGDLA